MRGWETCGLDKRIVPLYKRLKAYFKPFQNLVYDEVRYHTRLCTKS